MNAAPKPPDAEPKPAELIRGGLADYLKHECTVLERGNEAARSPLVMALAAVEDAARTLLQDYEDACRVAGAAPTPVAEALAHALHDLDRVRVRLEIE
jgi:hypothetical protein